MTHPSRYQYLPLEKASRFRLLKLYTDDGKPPLRAELIEGEIGEDNDYECLSYSWGAHPPIYAIQIAGKELPITQTVLDALISIRMLYKSKPWIFLWVDSICINQKDQEERSSQVGHMAKIYSLAHQVLVYLGLQHDGSEEIPELCRKINIGQTAFDTMYPNRKGQGGRMSYMTDDEHDAVGIPKRKDPVWDSMRAFLRRAWFTRTWIMQEAVLARKTFFVCGGWGCDGTLLLDAWDAAEGSALPIVHVTPLGALLKEFPELKALSQIRLMLELGWGLEEKPKYRLIDLLQQSRGALATDPRDFIYGVLGLSSETDKEAIRIDYSEPVADLYLRVARYIVTQGHGPQLLYNIVGLESKLGLPSWVPDWSAQGMPPFTLAPQRTNTDLDPPYVCAGGDSIDMRLSPDGKQLISQGYFIDDIQDLAELPNEAELQATHLEEESNTHSKPLEYFTRFLQEMEDLLQKRSAYSVDQIQEVIWRTSIWNRSIGRGSKAPARFTELFQDLNLLDSLDDAENLKLYVRAKLHALDEEVGFTVPEPIVMKEFYEMRKRAHMIGQWGESLCMRMHRCLTQRGYLGHVPKTARAGDRICVLAGAAIPFVVRAINGEYTLMGQCYLHGFMEGEALSMPDSKPETITLV